ncbi:MAG: endonuclease/exonuclease/phosphatase family protein [Gammaproteobacteria bacterium]
MRQFKIISWNIEHFNGAGGQYADNRARRIDRVARVVDYLNAQQPDIFGLSEVEGELVYDRLTGKMPNYSFFITEGQQTQEILIGIKSNVTAFFTQRDEFKRNNPYLRPAALVTVRDEDVHLPILFTHLKSMPSPEGFGLRDSMFEKIFNLKKQLDNKARQLANNRSVRSNFIVLGDMNTMGMDYYRSKNDISKERELEVITARFKLRKMIALKKTHDFTYFNGSDSDYPPSNLDHVFVADHLSFADVDSKGSKVFVDGWAQLTTDAEKDAWIAEFSDHAPIVFTVTGA